MNRADWTLLALSAAEGEPLTPVQLQKSLYVLGRECADDVGSDFYDFQPYNYGPFDATVYSDAESLEERGLAVRMRSPYRSWVEYAATPQGLKRAKDLPVDPHVRRYLRSLVEWSRRLTFNQLVRAIYQRYPETRARSIFQG